MNTYANTLLLLGIGGAGCAAARGVRRAYGGELRALAVDSDASSGSSPEMPFVLIGGDRLAGRGAGGLPAEARAAFLDSQEILDPHLEGVRTAVVVTALGGGTGGGATAEIVKRLSSRGIASIVFAALPFSFEGRERAACAGAALGSVERAADATVPMPLDALMANSGCDSMKDAFARMADTLATAVTLFWRILERPGYISLDEERLRTAIAEAGRGRFATASASGERRAEDILSALSTSPLLAGGGHAPTKSILLGILAGDDLRLSEVARLADGTRDALGRNASFQLGTVNDESTFSGRIAVAALVFEESALARPSSRAGRASKSSSKGRKLPDSALEAPEWFANSEKTMWHDENLDIPTYLRRSLTIDR